MSVSVVFDPLETVDQSVHNKIITLDMEAQEAEGHCQPVHDA